ncbi:hypothetical protein [Solibacillus daqui]|uniref:hypothetical protein n=1 Tax=Solibacillus daqui TaxID=2912187 RepID=UPI002366CD5F|nr:hypothetical protein [Solibacillus daqui]
MTGSFEVAFKSLVDQRIEDIYREKEFSNQDVEINAEIELKLNAMSAEANEKERKQILESLQDTFYKYHYSLLQKIYEEGFLDGLYLDKKSYKR